MSGNPGCPKKIEQRYEINQQLKQLNRNSDTQTQRQKPTWTGNTTDYLFGNELEINGNNTTNSHVEFIKVLEKINSTMSLIKDQQDELNSKFDTLDTKLNRYNNDFNQIKICINEILCPLIKEISNQVLQKAKGLNKQTLAPLHDKLINFMSKSIVSSNEIDVADDTINAEWTTSSTLDNLFTDWEQRRQQTANMLNVTSKLSFLLMNISSLKLYIYDLFELLNQIHVSIIVLNGTRDDNDALKCFSIYLTNFQLFHQQGTNAFGGVLIAVHRSIPVQRVIKFDSICNLIVLDVRNSSRKFQLATYYSPPNENIPLNIFKEIL
ncbi:unnamed protein product, partial [Rotaria magnacalcarata]